MAERQRHYEFADDLRMGNEWFQPSPKLIAHIAGIRRTHMGSAA